MTSKNKITCKPRNIILQGNIITTYAGPLQIIKNKYNMQRMTNQRKIKGVWNMKWS